MSGRKILPPKRTIFKPARQGKVSTSENISLGASELSVNNALQVIPHETGNMGLYNRYFGNISPNELEFYLYLEPTRVPSTYEPMLGDHVIENSNQIIVFIPAKKFTDGKNHKVLGIMWEGKRLKLKWSGENVYAEPINGTQKLPFFYIEGLPETNLDDFGNSMVDINGNSMTRMTKYYGVITTKAQREASGTTEFGKRRKQRKYKFKILNKEIKYLMKVR